MTYRTYTTGYSLVEVLVAVSILLLAIVGPMTIASQGIKSSTFSLEQNTAFFLAQEGVEAMFALRGDSALVEIDEEATGGGAGTAWDWIDDVLNGNGAGNGPCNITADGHTCSFGIDFSDETIFNNFTPLCDSGNESNCLLYTDETNSRAVSTHNSADDPSPYTRIITVTRKTDFAIEVSIEVSWSSHAFGDTQQTVTVTTDLFDLLL
ncbi:hypothetical protein N8083_01725 [Candidatus Pacebacteria bacterium]|nr:hypothetical protein [Candidatus Paceibacterota bacterium]